MIEEPLPSAHYLQKKFQEWFRDPIPPEAGHSNGDSIPAGLPSPAEEHPSIRHPVSADLLSRALMHPSYYPARNSHVDALQKLFELFIFGLQGAISVGVGVGFIILIMYSSNFGWGKYWPSPIVVTFLAMIIGFWVGLLRGSVHKLREKYSYEDKL
jgi:hypothetical protein